MTVAVMVRETWTDEQLDDLNKKVDEGFGRVDRGMKDLRRDMNERFNAIDARFESLNRTLIGAAAAIVAALIGSNAF